MDVNRIITTLGDMFPEAKCELDYRDSYQLSIAVVLSAQTTDVSVNKVTPELFNKYPTIDSLAEADINDVKNIIRTIGLYHNKSKNIIALANYAKEHYNSQIPNNFDELVMMPGVGRKSANVILSECFNVPTMPVDTHVERIAKRLGFAYKNDSVLTVEKKLMKKIDKSMWNAMHHRLIFFGRYFCKAKNPNCRECPLIDICKEKQKNI